MRQETKHHRTHAHLYPARPPPWMPPSPAAAPYAAVPAAHLGDCAMHITPMTTGEVVSRHTGMGGMHFVLKSWCGGLQKQASCCLGCNPASERGRASGGRRQKRADRVQGACAGPPSPHRGAQPRIASPACHDHTPQRMWDAYQQGNKQGSCSTPEYNIKACRAHRKSPPKQCLSGLAMSRMQGTRELW